MYVEEQVEAALGTGINDCAPGIGCHEAVCH